MSYSLLKMQEKLRNIPMEGVQSVGRGEHGQANQILAMDEIRRRGEMQKDAAAKSGEEQAAQPPMIDQYMQMSNQIMGGPPAAQMSQPSSALPMGMPQPGSQPQPGAMGVIDQMQIAQAAPPGSYRGGGLVDYIRRYHEGGGVGSPDEVRRRREAHLGLYGSDPGQHIHQSMTDDPVALPQQPGSGYRLGDAISALSTMSSTPGTAAELERAKSIQDRFFSTAVSPINPMRVLGDATTAEEQYRILAEATQSADPAIRAQAERRMAELTSAEAGLHLRDGRVDTEAIESGYAAEQARSAAARSRAVRGDILYGTAGSTEQSLPTGMSPQELVMMGAASGKIPFEEANRRLGEIAGRTKEWGANSVATGSLDHLSKTPPPPPGVDKSWQSQVPWLEVVKAGLNVAAGESHDPIQNLSAGLGSSIGDYQSRQVQERSLASEIDARSAKADFDRAAASFGDPRSGATLTRRIKVLEKLAASMGRTIDDPEVIRRADLLLGTGGLSGSNLITGGNASLDSAGVVSY
tara:strand:+ start:15005 stop:16570 length:1566 start_codon:yes stop_codon:yes gene_type:complete